MLRELTAEEKKLVEIYKMSFAGVQDLKSVKEDVIGDIRAFVIEPIRELVDGKIKYNYRVHLLDYPVVVELRENDKAVVYFVAKLFIDSDPLIEVPKDCVILSSQLTTYVSAKLCLRLAIASAQVDKEVVDAVINQLTKFMAPNEIHLLEVASSIT